MPFPNEHACRIRDPQQFDRIRRDDTKDPNVLLGFKGGGSGQVQAYRYPTERWSEDKAREHCEVREGTFEAASASEGFFPELQAHGVEHLEQYAGVWAVSAKHFREIAKQLDGMDLTKHVQQMKQAAAARQAHDANRLYQVTGDGIAVLNVNGTLTKYGSSMSPAPSMIDLRRAVRQAAGDDDARALVIAIDSPGGTAAGSGDLAADVRAAAQQKPVYGYIEDLAASAAYRVVSQATRIYANEDALVGSIGTFAVLEDTSASAAQAGVKVHVVRSGQFKGVGEPGTELTNEQLAEVQREVEATNEPFLRDVSRGRGMGMEAVRELADGRVHIAASAKNQSLIDEVGFFDDVLSALSQRLQGSGRGQNRRQAMATHTKKQGERLAETLNSLIDEQATEDRPRATIIDEMAEAAGIASSTVNGILNASINCPPRQRLEGFAEVLGTTTASLQEQAEADGCVYDDDGNPSQCHPKFEIEGEYAVRKAASRKGGRNMAEGKTPTPSELKQKFPQSTAEDREYVIDQGMTHEQASEYMANAFAARLQNREQEQEKEQSGKGGSESGKGQQRGPVGEREQSGSEDGDEEAADGADAFEQAVSKRVANGQTRQSAIKSEQRKNPENHRDWLASVQSTKQSRRQVERVFSGEDE